MVFERQSSSTPDRPYPCVISLGFISGGLLHILGPSDTDYVLVRGRFRLHLCTHQRKLPPSRLNADALEMPEKRDALFAVVAK